MIIGIDGNEANVASRVGIGEYSFEVIFNISRFIKNSENKVVTYLKNRPTKDMPSENHNFSYNVFGPRKMWTQFALPVNLLLGRTKPDIFFSPSHYSPRFSRMPTCISVMDLSFHYFPELFAKKDLYQLMNWTKYSVKKARVVFTISKASKNDIIKIYDIPSDRVVITYPGVRSFTTLSPHIYTNNMKNKFNISNDYFLFVGTLQPRKNIERLIEAFSILIKKNNDLNLVIVGKKGWLYDKIVSAPKKFGIESKVLFLDFVENDDLPYLYKNAVGFVFPSLYEGFGLPVLEAMKHDCPVITSNSSSLPEAGGDAAMYVDPLDVNDIAKKMSLLLDDKDIRKKMIEKGRLHLKNFSWEDSARKVLETIEGVVHNKHDR